MNKFEVGDKVKLVWDWTEQNLYREFVGQEFIVDEVDDFNLLHVHSLSTVKYGEPVTFWVPREAVKKVCTEKVDPDPDRYVITLERFDMDGKKYMSGSADICGPEFYGMWDCYIA